MLEKREERRESVDEGGGEIRVKGEETKVENNPGG